MTDSASLNLLQAKWQGTKKSEATPRTEATLSDPVKVDRVLDPQIPRLLQEAPCRRHAKTSAPAK